MKREKYLRFAGVEVLDRNHHSSFFDKPPLLNHRANIYADQLMFGGVVQVSRAIPESSEKLHNYIRFAFFHDWGICKPP